MSQIDNLDVRMERAAIVIPVEHDWRIHFHLSAKVPKLDRAGAPLRAWSTSLIDGARMRRVAAVVPGDSLNQNSPGNKRQYRLTIRARIPQASARRACSATPWSL
jgi:hypothetical protein